MIIIRKIFPHSTKLLGLIGLVFSLYTLKDFEWHQITPLIILLVLVTILSEISFSIRKKGAKLELGYSLFWIFYPVSENAIANIRELGIQQASNRYFRIGFLTNDNRFLEVDRKPTLDVAAQTKKEIEQKIKENWSRSKQKA